MGPVVLQVDHAESTKKLERAGQRMADNANELLKLIVKQRSQSPALAPS